MQLEVADVFDRYGDAYRSAHAMPANRLRVMRAIEVCRTKELGGHVDECEHCGTKLVSYNSCRNRHCPKCQFLKKEQWIEAREKDLLPIVYFHVVFTIPHLLNSLVLYNQELFYNLLFRAVSETLFELGQDPKRLGAELGFISILHTWGQNLTDHFHVHSIVTGGGLTPNGEWKSCKGRFFVDVKVLSKLFRGKFLAYLKELHTEKKLRYPGDLKSPGAFNALISKLYETEWVSYCKTPFQKTQNVIDYLGRYTHRIAISNHRLIKLEDDRVTFRWRDYADDNKTKIMTLDADEFIRRFLLHVLPDRFVKVRHYGILANRCRRQKIERARELLGAETAERKQTEEETETWRERLLRLAGFDVTRCPNCGERTMRTVETILPARCKGPPRI
jgi:Putative transposase/Transposase zinc-binding domain